MIHSKIVSCIVSILVLSACVQDSSDPDRVGEPIDSTQFQIAQRLDSLKRINRKQLLDKINDIEIKEKEKEAYRFEWSRAFLGPMLYTIEDSEGRFVLKIVSISQKETDSVDKAEMVIHDPIFVSKNDWNEFKALLDSANYWHMNAGINEGRGMLDGSFWTLEGKIPANDSIASKYQEVTRFSPDTGLFLKACLKLIELGPKIEGNQIY